MHFLPSFNRTIELGNGMATGGWGGAGAPPTSKFFSLLIYNTYIIMPSLTKEDTRHSCAQKADSTAIGNHVGDPPNNDLKKKKLKDSIAK